MNKNTASLFVMMLVLSGLNVAYTEYRLGNLKISEEVVNNYYVTNETTLRMFLTDGNSTVSIMSLDKYQVVHSKVIIDANLPDSIRKVEIRINNTFEANYLPYVWNNIRYPAGLYNISVHAWDGNNTEYSDFSLVEIPKFEIYTPANFSVREDIVIHEGQLVVWRDGQFNLCTPNVIENGVVTRNSTPVYVNVYGRLILINATVAKYRGFFICSGGKVFFGNDTVLDYGGGSTLASDKYALVIDDWGEAYFRNSTKDNNTNAMNIYAIKNEYGIYYLENGCPINIQNNGVTFGTNSADDITVRAISVFPEEWVKNTY